MGVTKQNSPPGSAPQIRAVFTGLSVHEKMSGKTKSCGYERVKRAFGPEQVAAAVEADKQREQAEKGRQRPRHSVDRHER